MALPKFVEDAEKQANELWEQRYGKKEKPKPEILPRLPKADLEEFEKRYETEIPMLLHGANLINHRLQNLENEIRLAKIEGEVNRLKDLEAREISEDRGNYWE
jgi:hypothetical protein